MKVEGMNVMNQEITASKVLTLPKDLAQNNQRINFKSRLKEGSKARIQDKTSILELEVKAKGFSCIIVDIEAKRMCSNEDTSPD